MRIYLTLFIFLTALVPSFGLTFSGSNVRCITVTPPANTGLEAVYVFEQSAGTSISYPSTSAHWYRFSNLGGGYAEEIASSVDGNSTSVKLGSEDMGYIVEDGGRRYCYWVLNYANHRLDLRSITPSAEQNCGLITFDFDGNASEIPYYTATGRRMTLDRELELSWNTLQFDQDAFMYTTVRESESYPSLSSHFSAPAPMISTQYVLEGDRFLRTWGMAESISSADLAPTAVAAETRAIQTERNNDNEQKGDNNGLGGSAPCEITFEAIVSDAVVYKNWEISRDADFGILENSYSDLDFSYTFTENGTYYVRFCADNSAGTCPYTGTTYEIFIGESKLLIPNAFSPQSSPGVNDEWKVSYKSLIEYECHVFNRLGTCMFSTTDPAIGWDGKYRGKYVPAGVYYYVIKARGADGLEYKRAGDINIINYKGPDGSSSGSNSESEN